MESLKSLKIEKKQLAKIGLSVAGLVGLYLGKQYFNGGVCKVQTSLSGQVIIITGANTGIGKETARLLASLGAEVILACRDEAKGQAAADEIKASTKNEKVHSFKLDLSDFESVNTFATQILSKFRTINTLIHNAGVWQNQRVETKDGFEETFQTNYLSPIYLTHLLLDSLSQSGKGRVIYVSSGLHKRAKEIKLDDLQSKTNFEGYGAYSHSKLASQMFFRLLSKKTEAAGVKVVTLHPGVIRTELGRNRKKDLRTKIIMPLIYPLWWYMTKDVTHGSQTTLYCAVVEFEQLTNGGYYGDCKLEEMSETAKNDEVSNKLWEVTHKLFEEKGVSLKF